MTTDVTSADTGPFIGTTPHPLLERDTLSPGERTELLEAYVTRGRALHLENDRGLIDSHRRRALHLGQFFTPSRVARVLAQAMGLVDHPGWVDRNTGPRSAPETGSLVDFAGCGNGRLLQIAPPGWTRHGADIDPLACRAAQLIDPSAEIIEASLLDFRAKGGGTFSAAIINPPFSVNLTNKTPLDLQTAQWGIWGRDTSVESHVAALELAANMAAVVGALLPTSFVDAGLGRVLEKISSTRRYGWGLRLRIDLPPDTFRDEGTEWPCSCVIVGEIGGQDLNFACTTWPDVEAAVASWVQSQGPLRGYPGNIIDALRNGSESPSLAGWRVPLTPAGRTRPAAAVPEEAAGSPTVRLSLGGRAHRIMLKPNCLTAALAISEARQWKGWTVSDGFEPQAALAWDCDLVRNAGGAEEAIRRVVAAVSQLEGIQVVVDDQLWTHARRADKRAAAELTPFAQWVRRHDGWEERWTEERSPEHPAIELLSGRRATFGSRAEAIPLGLELKAWSRVHAAHVTRAWPAFPVYDFARADIVRVLARQAALYSAKQGLGKTRFSIGAFLASGMSRGLWVLENRLVNEFKRELRRLGLLNHFHHVDTKNDLRHLRAFNVITYARLWRPVNEGAEKRDERWGPGKSFAAALARRNLFVVVDEAHKLRGATSKQGVAGRHLCSRAARVLLMTGTAVSSYPRNILGLVAAGWGDGSTFNPYGYRRPVPGGYAVENGRTRRHRNPLIRGVTRFVDTFVDSIWFTPSFEQTASDGMKSREIPRVKDLPLWESFVRTKILRRLPGEPEVRASGLRTPEAHPEYVAVEPTKEHFAHYKLVLDRFADIWKKRIERERATGQRENSAAHILPELDALRFASTVPVAPHRWANESPLLRYGSRAPTALMLEAMKRIAAWVEAGDRVLVGAEKPDALRWLADLLADLPTYVPDAEPIAAVLALDADIQKRNALIDRVRDNGEDPVLLISVGMGKEGLNLPEFSKLLTLDLGWVPFDLDQFRHRILRPDQVGAVELVHLFHQGLIDQYMHQLGAAKNDAIANCIDGQSTEFDYSQWKDYRTFALEMLSQEGYQFAADLLARERGQLAA